ncbi:hypothetical protein CONCODRAFT_73282 [Conidiobolus coronatus NRRL 28638]|uniref:Uncharacterized protein n=1 Tax=Conidiobolus coronatus (strain ATCC 28846 / CBS 209.66 / NRRL 28638) TaxID=796925 RepID=A0A137NW48_CONC2|nr:hypothetical protein CONCODRAFT_73282 [Conidiobolus coronatus NRRL 28638]|eukprot:KXN66996.1 hypothetical protein CONCODRAFT_73282 [Conidiobolus coronatus NRRL 28638]
MSSKIEKLKSVNKRNLFGSSDLSKQSDMGIKIEMNSPKTENFVTESKPSKKSKLNDLHYKCLRKYLKEDILIGYTEAMEKLQEETDIKCSYSTIRKAIIKLREEINTNSTNLDPSAVKDRSFNDRTKLKDLHIDESELSSSESELKDDVKPRIQGSKLQKLHIECLKKYLREDASIGCYKAKTKLKQDTGLEASAYTIRKSLSLLKKETDQNSIEISDSDLETKVKCIAIEQGFKIKELHIECLKRYLKENNSIRASEAKNRLFIDTGLEVTAQVIRNTLVEIKEQKCLKKYLKENSLIEPTEAKNRLQEETGLKRSTKTIQKALINLREEMDSERINLDTSTTENNRLSDRFKLKDLHLESLKKYLKEDMFIGPTEAKSKFKEETGLDISVSTVSTALTKLRKEMGLDYDNLAPAVAKKSANTQTKLKGLYLSCLKKYLHGDNYTGPTEANYKNKEQVSLVISLSTFSNTMRNLRKEMDLEHADLKSTEAKGVANTRSKLNTSHLEFLKNILKEDVLIGPTEAKGRLKEEFSLEVSYSTVRDAIIKIKKELVSE